jgi:hypothetical protein
VNALEHDFAAIFRRLYARPELTPEQNHALETEYVAWRMAEHEAVTR